MASNDITVQTDEPRPQKPLRLWPGVVAVVLLLLVRFVVPRFVPGTIALGVYGEFVGTLVILLWWLFFSRAPWAERLGALGVIVVAVIATKGLLHESIQGGMMGMMFIIYALPVLCLALVAWAALSRRLAGRARWASMVAAILLACGVWTLFRTDGMDGEGHVDFAWRWTPTPEERLLAQAGDELTALPAAPPAVETPAAETPAAETPTAETPAAETPTAETPATETPAAEIPAAETLAAEPPAAETPAAETRTAETRAEWPGFRGPARDSILTGVRIETDWATSPPVELWQRPIGPGWSSFAVHGDRIYTQEQRGDDEVVACYDATTGKPVWAHQDDARFWEANAGAGPRATPTLSNGRVYTLGATGLLNVLDADDGALIWSRNAAADAEKKAPTWGFSGSPLVLDDLVIVAASGRLVAYDLATGEPRWLGPDGGASYSSPHLLTLDSVPQVLLLSAAGLISVAPSDGALLWQHAWEGYPIVQPAVTADGDVLISVNQDSGTRRLALDHGADGWTVEERWTTLGLKPYFNDFVVHEGHAYGFDGSILACIDLQNGERKWKGGRYGSGQLVLLADQDLLLVLAEKGGLALVSATPDKFTEVARAPAIEGKTWNHPVLAGDLLLVRNDQEMAAFRLSLAGEQTAVASLGGSGGYGKTAN